ncbi:hypothetical protein C0993_009898, partial [Termitomyces sp. T159_Od127]
MATQRAPPRRPGAIRDSSRSPAFRTRAPKTHAPIPSPTSAPLQVQRLLPTPPRPPDDGPGYPRRVAEPHWQVTDELLADIERADLQAQANSYAAPETSPHRRQQPRDSPKRHPASPTPPAQSPEPRTSPASPYIPYAVRRPPNAAAAAPAPAAAPADARPLLASLATQTPPLQTTHTRTPDRSLPVQEIEDEPAKNGTGPGTGTPTWQEISDAPAPPSQQEPVHVDDAAFALTPRSPTADLPETTTAAYYSRRPPRADLRSFDPGAFEGDTSVLVMNSEMPPQYTEPRRHHPADYAPYAPSPAQTPYREPKLADELQPYDSSYLQAYYQSPRPDAPVPPTPHSQTAAPSPLPLAARDRPYAPAGSPYPYPFNHFCRPRLPSAAPPQPQAPNLNLNTNPNTTPNAPTPAHPTPIHLQLARQWEIYALNHQNHHAPPSETASAFSPAPTPFEGSGLGAGAGAARTGGFAPWALLHTSRTLGLGLGLGRGAGAQENGGEIASMRSSPSHEPLEPRGLPPALGAGAGAALGVGVGGKKARRERPRERERERQRDAHARRAHPPPRVESTQPRDTSPDLSSSSSSEGEGEETAGEEREDADADGDGNWSGGTIAPAAACAGAGAGAEEDEWVDEEADGDDLLELEYHPAFVRGGERRRRRWEVGWEGVLQA